VGRHRELVGRQHVVRLVVALRVAGKAQLIHAPSLANSRAWK
jgi:hypothetical protein